MPLKSVRKRTKKLLQQLFELQQYDLELTGPFCLAVKFLLQRNKYCTSVEVTNDQDFGPVVQIDRSLISKFILSQLEAQRLANRNDVQISLTQLLNFILFSLPRRLSKDATSPTFFHWQCSRTHRTYFVFAFVENGIKMSSRAYSIQELLSLRSYRVPPALAAIAEKDYDLADVITITTKNGVEASSQLDPKRRVNSNDAAKKIEDDSSTGSDEVVYRGSMTRRGIPVETEWKYRGRSGSEVAANEPLSAPAGLNAQHNEGFQRFYKAVVSPTHVRVTAGGRIVPNTRNPASPTSRRVKDKAPADGQSVNGQSAHPQVEGIPMGKGPGPGMPVFAMPPHFYPPFHAQFPHLNAPMPMMPMAMGLGMPGGFPFPQAATSPGIPTPGSDSTLKENRSTKPEEPKVSKASESEKADNKVKISPPEQFDHTKPFVYNGQLMYPIPAAFPPHMGAQYMPPGFIGHPAYPLPQFPGPMLAPPHIAMNPMIAQMGFPPHAVTPSAAGNVAPTAVPSAASNLQPPSAPPISSIRPSDISKKQIESLRNALKYHEDQLQYNRHQIDEEEMEKTIKMLHEQIERFEALNQAQLAYEEKHYPKRDKTKEGMNSSGPRNVVLSKPLQSDETKSDSASQGGSKAGSQRRKDSFRPRPGINTNQNSEASFKFDLIDPVEPPAKLNDPVKKSSLPSCAALAPPFEPRSTTGFEPGSVDDFGCIDNTSLSDEAREAVEKRLLAAGRKDWMNSGNSPANGLINDTGSSNQTDHSPEHRDLGCPYLVGTLPTGINPQTARDADYVYERELTDDEARARYLYWGRAPRYVREGLPKYDGKNFYPPSPVKGSKSQSPPSPPRFSSRRIPIGNPAVDYRYEMSTREVSDPFRPATPVNAIQTSKRLVDKENTPPKAAGDVKAAEERTTTRVAIASENDAKSIESQDRRLGESSSAKFLHNMLKRGITRSSDVLPSAVSSTTAQGYLPQYTGYETLAASLSPAMLSPSRLSPDKSPEGGGALLTPVTEKRVENCPPVGNIGPASLEEQFRHIVSLDAKHRSALPSYWKAA